MRASTAWTLPTCLCSRPARARMNTSNRGHSFGVALMGTSRRLRRALLLFLGVREGRVTYPLAFVPCAATRVEALAIAGTVALQHVVELAPIDDTEVVVLSGVVPFQ